MLRCLRCPVVSAFRASLPVNLEVPFPLHIGNWLHEAMVVLGLPTLQGCHGIPVITPTVHPRSFNCGPLAIGQAVNQPNNGE